MERGQLATGFFLLVHDESTGRPRIGRGPLRCWLVGVQLADLVIGGRLTMDGDRVVVATADVSGLDELGTLVLDGVAHSPDAHPVRAWTDALGELLHDLVVGRLTADRVLRSDNGRGPFGRRRTRYPAVDLVRARRPAAGLREMFADPRRFTLPGAFVASVLTTVGADAVLEPGIGRAQVRSIAEQAGEHLPGSLGRLRAGLADAVSSPAGRR